MASRVLDYKRYERQMLLKELGRVGQKKLSSKKVVIIGCGGLGSNSANLLVRMGIGAVDLIDFDTVELSNLHRTSLFTQRDIGKQKSVTLKQRLRQINPEIRIRAITKRIDEKNINNLLKDADVIIDGTDSLPLRFLVNKTVVHYTIPWVYAGVYSTSGMVMGIIPKDTACLQCISQSIPTERIKKTPVLGSLPMTIASIQCNETIKILLGKRPAGLIVYDVWNQCFDCVAIKRNVNCSICGDK